MFGLAIDDASVDVAVSRGIAQVNALDVRGPSAHVTAKGRLALTGAGDSDLSYVADVANLREFQSFVEQAIEGSAHVEGRVTGPAGAMATTGTLIGNNLAVGPTKALSLKSAFDLTIPDNDVKRTTGKVDLNGTFFEISGRRIDEVTATLNYDGAQLEVDATLAEKLRTLRFTGAIAPHPDHHEFHVRSLSILAGDVEWQMPQGQEAVAQYGADRLVIRNFQLARADSRIRIDGVASAKAPDETPLVVTVERVEGRGHQQPDAGHSEAFWRRGRHRAHHGARSPIRVWKPILP